LSHELLLFSRFRRHPVLPLPVLLAEMHPYVQNIGRLGQAVPRQPAADDGAGAPNAAPAMDARGHSSVQARVDLIQDL
jgi:hypothetical protein